MKAKDDDCLILVQMDANAKVGKEIIKDDPNPATNTGKLMLDIIERQNLKIANADKLCNGTITRERAVENKIEKSVIDYILMCERLQKFLLEMSIDEDRDDVLCRYKKIKNGRKVITSDHNILYSKFEIQFNKKPISIRREFFHLKCVDSRNKFFKETESTAKLSSCFSDSDSFISCSNKFFKTLNRTFHSCFKKIRIKTGNQKNNGDKSVQAKLKLKTKLRKFLKNNTCKIGQEIALSKLESLEDAICEEVADKNTEKAKKYLENIESLDGNFSQVGFWKLEQKLSPFAPDPPMAKHDNEGNIITAPEALKTLYLQTYQNRLKHRLMKPELMDIYFLKTKLWMSRLSNLKEKKTPPWNEDKLDTILKSMKNNKTMDPNGMVNEVFKAGVIEADLKKALLYLLNGIKSNQIIPFFMTLSNITSLYKNKGSRFDLNNDRGIFILTVLKKILDKMIYSDNIKDLDLNMSDSNVGSRRGRNIKDHLLVIYGIINSVLKGGEECIDIQIYDLVKAFDAMWLDDCLNDIFDTLPESKRNDEISLLYESNKVNMVAVKTPVGITERVNMELIVQQGGTWGSMLCSNTVDTLGKKCRDRNEHIYLYKKKARILPLAFVDDLNGIAKCGLDSIALNTFITTQIELKKLKFHVPDHQGKTKCHKLHIGKSHNLCPTLTVHGTIMPEVTEDVYLGDIISNDGKNTKMSNLGYLRD